MTRVLVIDNYDSFTWNLVHLLGPLATSVEVVRNDAVTTDEVLASQPDAIVLSPGPCTPNEAGICLDLVKHASPEIPTFGVCLGLQTIGQVFGGTVSRAPLPIHGKVSDVEHHGTAVFRGINGPFKATRYHSLIVDRETCPADLLVTAETADGLVMGLSHRALPIHGVQFHPESILSEHGVMIMRNFFDLAAEWNATRSSRSDASPAGH
ncbi:anthranilate synthase component II [Microvirga roseola]|uniref:anthranilate synthase component II n=1 Tax=Microvirga roseola TaxID=2883126 RepID=UPI001E57BAAC|nr:aminodeoxychorismate/anthranilate synthase component II [Microvirga roseola]